MDTHEFLSNVLARGNHYCLLQLLDGGKDAASRKQTFYNNIDDLVVAAKQADNTGWDVYMAMGSFAERGKRTNDRVQNVKALFLDLDIDEDDERKYSTQREALNELRSFCRELKLPKPFIVNSGRGIHVHWAFKESGSCITRTRNT